MSNLKEELLKQLDTVIAVYDRYNSEENKWHTYTINHFYSLALAVIERIAGLDSIYGQQASIVMKDRYSAYHELGGILQALRDDVDHGFLKSLKEIVHGEMFSDFLDMADFLLREGYKDAAAVMGGGVLESHLRQLCIKHNIDIETVVNSDVRPKKSDQLNSELARNRVYNILDQKNVTAWLDLRNKAAHAKYGEYTKEQVSLMLQGLRNFITRYPA